MILLNRLKQAQVRMERARVFYNSVKGMEAFAAPTTDVKKQLVVPMSADKGLCGAVNSNISKSVKSLLKDRKADTTYTLHCIGEKAPSQLARDYGQLIVSSNWMWSNAYFNSLGPQEIWERSHSTFCRLPSWYKKCWLRKWTNLPLSTTNLTTSYRTLRPNKI